MFYNVVCNFQIVSFVPKSYLVSQNIGVYNTPNNYKQQRETYYSFVEFFSIFDKICQFEKSSHMSFSLYIA